MAHGLIERPLGMVMSAVAPCPSAALFVSWSDRAPLNTSEVVLARVVFVAVQSVTAVDCMSPSATSGVSGTVVSKRSRRNTSLSRFISRSGWIARM